MCVDSRMFSRCRALTGALLLVFATVTTVAAEPKRVLLLESYGRSFGPYGDVVRKLLVKLAQQSEPMDVYEASFATARFAEGAREDPFVDYINSLFYGRKLDLVIAAGAPAARFAQGHRQLLFPSTPMLLTGFEERRLKDIPLTSNDTVVAFKTDHAALIAHILTVLPETNHIAIVIGSSPNEKFWKKEYQKELKPLAAKVTFTWFDDLSFEQMKERAATLPPHSAIYFGPLN